MKQRPILVRMLMCIHAFCRSAIALLRCSLCAVGIRIRCATGVFGADPSSLDQVQDGPFQVPRALVLMKNALISQDALRSEGIFRLAGEVSSIAKVKSELNAQTFTSSDDVNAVATLIKVRACRFSGC